MTRQQIAEQIAMYEQSLIDLRASLAAGPTVNWFDPSQSTAASIKATEDKIAQLTAQLPEPNSPAPSYAEARQQYDDAVAVFANLPSVGNRICGIDDARRQLREAAKTLAAAQAAADDRMFALCAERRDEQAQDYA